MSTTVNQGQNCEKPGKCPAVPRGRATPCIADCGSDQNCRGAQKCCPNGCGIICKDPVLY